MPETKIIENAGPRLELSDAQRDARSSFRQFVSRHIAPEAGAWDRAESLPMSVIDELRSRGYLGALLPQHPGGPMDSITYGLLTEEIARGCSSVRSLLTVHDMVAQALWKWSSATVRDEFGAPIARGELLCALALSEPEAGSDAASVTTIAVEDGDEYRLTGRKKWTTFGQIADLFLVLARCQEKLTAFLVPAASPGLQRIPMKGLVGTRASLLAEIDLQECRIPRRYLIGRPGFGFSHVISTALDHGRYSVAWGAVGIAQACLDACLDYTSQRKQFGVELRRHQLVQRKLTDMIVNTRAARLLCCRAGYLRDTSDPGAPAETLIAKYFASQKAVHAANDAIQLHGANGLTEEYPVARYLRDAKVTEIIEGSSQIQQINIAGYPFSEM